MDDNIIICRCEEITYGEIKQAIREGARTIDGIKRMTRAGKGLCQGRTCRAVIIQILRQEVKKMPEGDELSSSRPPIRALTVENMMSQKE